jgi:hypothetical protein
LWEDLADIDVLRVGDTYYYSASNMHYSPGAPILRSKDLAHWEYVGHSVPVLDFGPAYNLDGGNAYIRGTWASFLGYRKSNPVLFPLTFAIVDMQASAICGRWQKETCLLLPNSRTFSRQARYSHGAILSAGGLFRELRCVVPDAQLVTVISVLLIRMPAQITCESRQPAGLR